MSQRDEPTVSRFHVLPSGEESGSIGIGAMIVFIALILVAAVASTIIIKTAEELQQNAEATSQDTRDQISGKISISDVYVAAVANPLCVDTTGDTTCAVIGGLDDDTDVDFFDVIARVSSGSLNVQEGDISWYVTCNIQYSQGTATANTVTTYQATTLAAIDFGTADARALDEIISSTTAEGDGTDLTYNTGDEITAGTTFHFAIVLSKTNIIDEGTPVDVGEDIEAADFATAAAPGCDAEAGAGEELGLRIVVDGGGETLAQLKIQSITLGTSVM